MLASLTTLFIRVWEKALFLIALLACLTLCSLATHYFTAAPEEQDEIGHQPVAVSILPWQDRSFFSISVPEVTTANPFAHTLVNLTAPPEPPKPETKEPPKKEEPPKPAEQTAKTEPPKPDAAQPPAQETPPQKPEPPKKEEPPPPPKKPDIVFTIAYRGFYIDVRGESLAMLIVTDSAKKEKRLVCKKGTVICDKVTFQSADDKQATFTDADGNSTSINWNNKHTFTFKQE
ncbi:MAG: hypothetical protein IKZ46_15960 [Victivallales bacterium]|nr:hypothetical protein [Victivallales bacterium]